MEAVANNNKSTYVAPQTAYSVSTADLQAPQPWRINQIFQSINARITAVQQTAGQANNTASSSVQVGNVLAPLTVSGNNLSLRIVGPLYKTILGELDLALNSTNYVVLPSGQLSQNAVNLANAYGFNTTNFVGGNNNNLTVLSIAVNNLIAGNTFQLGTSVFASNNNGPFVEVGSTGIVLGDNHNNAVNTVTVTSIGISVVNNNNAQVAITNQGVGVYSNISAGPYVNVETSGILLDNGNHAFQTSLNSTQVKIAANNGPSLTLSANTIDMVSGNYTMAITASQIQLAANNGPALTLSANNISIVNGNYSLVASASQVALSSSNSYMVILNSNNITLSANMTTLVLTSDTLTFQDTGNNSLAAFEILLGANGAVLSSTQGSGGWWGLQGIAGAGQLLLGSGLIPNAVSIEGSAVGGSIAMVPSGVISIANNQVITGRQTGPGVPSGFADSVAQNWCHNLYIALAANNGHGLIN